jgi:Uma2 family endonuclease
MGEALRRYSLDKKFKKEMIDGEIYLMAAASNEHIDVQGNLYNIFSNYFKQNGRRCRARFEAQLNMNEKNYFKLDLMIFCKESNNGEIPLIIVEILSKSTAKKDLGVKMEKYAELGIKEYWIITWEISTLTVYLLNEEQEYKLYNVYTLLGEDDEEEDKKEAAESFSPVSFPELTVNLSDVFDIFE